MFLSQIDRFFALYWHCRYKDRVTNKTAIKTMILTKMISTSLTLVLVLIDPDSFKCHRSLNTSNAACSYFVPNNVFYHTIPMTGCLSVLLLVTVYILKLIIRNKNMVVPIAHLPPPLDPVTLSTISGALDQKMDDDQDDGSKTYNYTIKRLNSNPNLFVKKAIIPKKIIFKTLPLVVNIQETAKSAMKVKLFMFSVYTHLVV